MAIQLTCPLCHKTTHVSEDLVGRHAKCPLCDSVFLVPQPAELAKDCSGGRSETAGTSPIVQFLLFRAMITPFIIQVLFWLGVFGSLLMGGLFLASSLISKETGIVGIAYGLAFLIGGPLTARIYCELLIVFFRMNETLSEIRANTQHPGKN